MHHHTTRSIVTLLPRFASILCCSLVLVSLQAQETGDSVRINPKFMQELDAAFSFTPLEAPIQVPDNVLTREQLHQWVNPDEQTAVQQSKSGNGHYDPTDPNRFDSTYFALKMYLVDFCHWRPVGPQEIKISGLAGALTDGLQHYGNNCHSLATGGVGATVDVNALAQFIRPSQIKLRKSRALADSSRDLMDRLFPREGTPLYTRSDTGQTSDSTTILARNH